MASGLRPGAALVAAHFCEFAERRLEALGHGGLRGGAVLLAFVGIGDLDHALDGENAVQPRRLGLDAAGERVQRRDHGLEHLVIDLDDRRHPFALDVERPVQRAARHHLAGARPQCRLDRVPAGRQAQPQVEPLGVDRADLPRPPIGAGHAVAARKTGHAR